MVCLPVCVCVCVSAVIAKKELKQRDLEAEDGVVVPVVVVVVVFELTGGRICIRSCFICKKKKKKKDLDAGN